MNAMVAKSLDAAPSGTVMMSHALAEPNRHPECGSHSAPCWYVVQTHPKAEDAAAAELRNQDFAVFLPKKYEPGRKATPGCPRSKDRPPALVPFFPGYLFVQFCRHSQQWRRIHSTRGVRRLFSSSPETPTSVPTAAVEALMLRASKLAVLPDPKPAAIDAGAVVEVIAGPFAGQQGMCLASTATRVRVLLLQWGREVEVPRGMVEAV